MPAQLSLIYANVTEEDILLRKELDGAAFRLIGVGVSDLAPAAEADRGDLVDTGLAREKATEKAIDALRARFGESAVIRGLALTGKKDMR